MSFDAEKFIKEVESRKAIWDPSAEEYADKNCRQRLWNEVTCSMFNDEMSEDEKRDISKLLQQKWRNIRTSFTRELRRRAGRGRAACSRKSPYIYYDRLKFLKTVLENKANDNDDTGQEDYEIEEFTEACKLSKASSKKMRRVASRDHDLDRILNRYAAINGRYDRTLQMNPKTETDRLFILSLVDDFNNIPPKKKLTAKLEIMKIIKWAQTPQKIYWAPPYRYSNSDHDYVRGSRRFSRSTQTSMPEGYYFEKYRESQNFPLFERPCLMSDSEVSNYSDTEELEIIDESVNDYIS